jgi:acetyl-CoA C-acetyltransferase
MAMHAIRAGEGDVFISAGVETVSRAVKGNSDTFPHTENPVFADAKARTAGRDRREHGCAARCDPCRAGRVRRPVAEPRRAGDQGRVLRARDRSGDAARRDRGQHRRRAAAWRHPGDRIRLKPVFRPDGTVTAGNCCAVNDGAAALVVMSERKARELGIDPLARVVATGLSALSPEIMGLGPVQASRRALANAGMTIDDVDLVEINEAFAAQVIPSYRELGRNRPQRGRLPRRRAGHADGAPSGFDAVRVGHALRTLPLAAGRSRSRTAGRRPHRARSHGSATP